MIWHFNAYSLLLFICALATNLVTVYAWRQRKLTGAGPTIAFLGATIWSISYALAVGVHDPGWRILWAKAQHVGIALTAIGWTIFTIQYSGRENWLSWRNIILLSIIPVAGMVLALTNEYHHLIWVRTELRIVGPLALLDITYGAFFWIYFAWNYMVLLSSIAIFLWFTLNAPLLQRRQAMILLAGTLCPGIAIILYLSGFSPLPDLDLAPLGYSIGSLVFAWGMYRFHLFSIIPIARDQVIENMSDAVLVLDNLDRVADINAAMLQLIQQSSDEVVGQPVAQVLTDWANFIEKYRDVPKAEEQIIVGDDGEVSYFSLRITPLFNKQKILTGRVVVLRDTTDHMRSQEIIQHANQQLRAQLDEINQLQTNLREQAIRDALTGLFNRRYLDETLEREVARAVRDQSSLSIIILDVDYLKEINDQYGHAAGDCALQSLGLILSTQTRMGDIACRYGGDEFVVLMPDAKVENAIHRAESWLIALRNAPIVFKNLPLHLTFSAGVAMYPLHGATADELMRAADKALYLAKTSGRNRVIGHESPIIETPSI